MARSTKRAPPGPIKSPSQSPVSLGAGAAAQPHPGGERAALPGARHLQRTTRPCQKPNRNPVVWGEQVLLRSRALEASVERCLARGFGGAGESGALGALLGSVLPPGSPAPGLVAGAVALLAPLLGELAEVGLWVKHQRSGTRVEAVFLEQGLCLYAYICTERVQRRYHEGRCNQSCT